MKALKFTAVLLCALLLAAAPAAAKNKKTDPWKQWLKEIDPILTRQERSVAKALQTLETRKRFQDLFWKARDPDPRTPQNEYKAEYYRRLNYVKRKLGGVKSDRGRIYILLGKPFELERFSGYQNLVECEVWSYRTGGRHGLFPFMNIVFYKPRDMGDFQLYHPGIHTPIDLLSPYYSGQIRSLVQAYGELKKNSTELAQASLSIIPSEGVPGMSMSLSSSNFALNKVYTLPEREAEEGYTRSFKVLTGSVQVTHSTAAIRGYGTIALSRNKGVTFLNYALMPEMLKLQFTSDDQYAAEVHVHINIEDEAGKLVYQNERKINVKVTPEKKQEIEKRKIVFMHFAPIIEGDFNVTLMFLNKTTQEFFTHKEKISISKDIPLVTVGFQLKTIETKGYMPFAAGDFLVFIDPRSTFNQKDVLEGVVYMPQGSQPPELFLENLDNEAHKIKVRPLVDMGNLYKFRLPLADVKDDNYRLMVKTADGHTHAAARRIHVLPFYIGVERPVTMAKPEPAASVHNYRFVQAQQHLNTGSVDRAIETFNKIPGRFWNAVSLPVIARAYYVKKDYARVVELLERENVPKGYATLILLANSSIELKQYGKAVRYLEQIRKYGDSVEINQLLAASYLSLGEQEKAKRYYEYARKLMKK
jgi:GWxTD domain-containing protein